MLTFDELKQMCRVNGITPGRSKKDCIERLNCRGLMTEPVAVKPVRKINMNSLRLNLMSNTSCVPVGMRWVAD